MLRIATSTSTRPVKGKQDGAGVWKTAIGQDRRALQLALVLGCCGMRKPVSCATHWRMWRHAAHAPLPGAVIWSTWLKQVCCLSLAIDLAVFVYMRQPAGCAARHGQNSLSHWRISASPLLRRSSRRRACCQFRSIFALTRWAWLRYANRNFSAMCTIGSLGCSLAPACQRSLPATSAAAGTQAETGQGLAGAVHVRCA